MATTESNEQLFQRFRDRGDARALAAVFDRTAPQLLLAAAHVTPEPAAAEDLVQDTFLHAMRSAAAWDPGRPLLPWLCGILQHRAIDLARRNRLRRGKAPLEELASTDAGPAAAAAASELMERVQRALDELQPPFREALVLRLAHGMTPTEIAHALGRPPATVRVQLMRGLELLRARLPVGVAGALALLLTQERGLAATRAHVLTAAGGSGALALLGARRAWLALGAAALALAVGYAVWPRDAAPASAHTAVADIGGGAPAAASRGARAADTDRAPARTEVPLADAATAPTTLRGRLVHARDRAPVAGGSVTVSFSGGRFVTDDPSFRTWPAPVTAAANADGTFAVAFATEPAMRITIEVSAPGFTPADTGWPSLKAGIDVDLGDVPLFPGRELNLRVVDEQGRPMPDIGIEVERQSGGAEAPESMFTMWSSLERTSGADGRLEPAVVPAPGRFGIRASSRLHGFCVLRPTQVELTDAPQFVDVVVARQPADDCVRGHVVDERGNPVAGVTVTVDPIWVDIASATSDEAGAFWLPLDQVAAQEIELHLPPTERAFALLEPERRYRSGSADAEVRVRRLPAFDVEVAVVTAHDGAPVTDYGLRWEIDYWADAMKFTIPPERIYMPAPAIVHAGGRTVLQGLHPGDYRLCVFPRDHELATAYLVPFQVGERGAAPVRVALGCHAPLTVHLRDETGAPLPGVTVELLHTMGNGGDATAVFSVEQLARGIGGGRDMAVALQTAVTDAAGAVRLRAPADETRVGLRVDGPGVRRQTQTIAPVPPSGSKLTLTLPAFALVRGRIGPPELLQRIGPSATARREAAIVRDEDAELESQCPHLYLRDAGGHNGGASIVRPDGTFAIDTAAPGDHDLVLDVDWQLNPGFFTTESFTIAHIENLRAGETRELTIDAARLLPARLRGTVRVDGAAWTAGQFGLLTADPADWRAFRIALDPAAGFDRALAPGRYLPFLEWNDGGEHHLLATERLELAARSDTARTFAFERRALALRVVRADGTPAAGERLRLEFVDFPEAATVLEQVCTAGDDGTVLLDPAPPGRVQFFVAGDGGALLGEAAAGAAARTEATLRLPR